MTETTMTCERFDLLLPDHLDGALAEPERLAAERHLAECARCGALVAEVEGVVAGARALPVLRPSRDLWAGIEQRIATPVVEIGPRPAAAAVRRAPSRRWLAAAAVLLVATTAGVTYQVTTRMQRPARVADATTPPLPGTPVPDHDAVAPREAEDAEGARAPRAERGVGGAAGRERGEPSAPRERRPSREAPGAAAPRPAVLPQGVAPNARLASDVESPAGPIERAYARELGELAAMVRQRRGALDPATVAVLEHSLKVIDEAIDRSREALRRDPASGFLQEQLNHALDKKVGLLRTAARIPTRT